MKYKRGYYDILLYTCSKYHANPAVRIYENGLYKTYTYSEIFGVCEYVSQILQQLNCSKGVIGLVTDRNIIVPGVIAAIHKQSCTFMFLNIKQDISTIKTQYKFKAIIVIEQKTNPVILSTGKLPVRTIGIFNLNIKFYCEESKDMKNETSCKKIIENSYIAATSGSTGEPKHILVPLQSILPNINDFTKLFEITYKDVIFFSTPLTFDPSMVEILLACMNGACLLIAPENAEVLFNSSNRDCSITFWQTTPSKFLQFSNTDLSEIILSADSTLRILALGGEPLNGIKRLKCMKSPINKTKIYVLYGVTEMSCWACATELDLKQNPINKEIPLGPCLSETEVFIKPTNKDKHTGKIILASQTRTCVLLNHSKKNQEQHSLKWIDTGDIGEVRNGTIYYRGRHDDVIKRFGNKVNLHLIEACIMKCPKINTCSCIWLPKPMLLVVYYTSEFTTTQELSNYLKCQLDEKHWPDRVIRVNNLPISEHGKISKKVLYKMAKSNIGTSTSEEPLKLTLLNEIRGVLNKPLTYDSIKNKNFFSIGGNSFVAVTMCNKISQANPLLGKSLLPYILDETKTIENILVTLQNDLPSASKPLKRVKQHIKDEEQSPQTKKQNKELDLDEMELSVIWSYDTGKCVDASPTLFHSEFEQYVTVGSHSGLIIVADARTGEIEGVLNAKSRIEAAVYCHCETDVPAAPRGVVGTYNGTIICFLLDKCKEIWKINIGSMIKSKATYCKGFFFVGSYDGCIRSINILNGVINAVIKVSDQGISADLVLAKNEYILAGTLSGVTCSINIEAETVAWRENVRSPVFAAAALFDDDKYALFADVSGELHCKTVEKGIKLWKHKCTKGNVFSSLTIVEISKGKWQLLFGCHDNYVYCYNITKNQPSFNWKCLLTSPVYSTPCISLKKYVLAASNNGRMTVIELTNGKILTEYPLPEEVYSSPAASGDYIYIGCRNDYLYGLKLST